MGEPGTDPERFSLDNYQHLYIWMNKHVRMASTHATNYVNVLDSDVFGFRHVKSLVISLVAVLYDRLGIGNLCSNFSWNKLGAPKSSEFFLNQTMTTKFFVESCFFQLWKV